MFLWVVLIVAVVVGCGLVGYCFSSREECFDLAFLSVKSRRGESEGEGQEKECDDEEMKNKEREEKEKKVWPDGWSVEKVAILFVG